MMFASLAQREGRMMCQQNTRPCDSAQRVSINRLSRRPGGSCVSRRVARSASTSAFQVPGSNPAVGDGSGSGGGGSNGTNIKCIGGEDSDGGHNSSHRLSPWLLSSLAFTVHSLLLAPPATAAKPKPAEAAPPTSQPQFGDIDAYVEQAWAFAGPALSRLGVSGVLGIATAGVLKFIGRALLLMVGFTFVVVQGLKQVGVLTEVRWGELLKLVGRHLDQDGNKVFDGEDVKILAKKGLTMLTSGVPSVGGFLAGFTFGLKYF